jgi:serine/threonine-protein kinase
MSNQRDQPGPSLLARAEAIFFEVGAMAPADREAAIVRLCDADAGLEVEVRSLVAAAAKIGGFLDAPALGRGVEELARDAASRDELVGTRLGSFTIDRRLASGGMGTVYVASRSDGTFAQQVAIKVVKRGMDSEDVLRRFRDERQILAGLDHPNIARLLDAGATEDGRPYFVMEYVDGLPIDTYCDKQRLSVRERLKLFQSVCEGVHAAHQALVIHRDLKPGNILVTAQGTPKLLDFGIAKLMGPRTGSADARVTSDTERRLTPEYASPEQVEGGSITTASDVYSLGVILYELLTGTRPYYFALKTTEEVKRLVCGTLPKPPSEAVTLRLSASRTKTGALSRVAGTATNAGASSTVAPPTQAAAAEAIDHPKTRGVTSTRLRGQLRGDLDTIALMALRKEPQRRYASAEALAADIQRYLSGLPVLARRDTLAYRAGKFVRRHAVGVGATALAITLLSGATVMLASQRAELSRQRDALVNANAKLTVSNAQALEANEFLQDLISSADVGEKGPTVRLADVLQDASALLAANPPQDEATRAAREYAIGHALLMNGKLDDAEPLLKGAMQRWQAAAGERDDRTLAARRSLAELALLRKDFAGSERDLRALLAIDAPGGDDASRTRRSRLLNDLGACLRQQRKLDEALTVQTEALALRSELLGAESAAVATSHNNLASIHFDAGRYAEAVAAYETSLAIRRGLLRDGHPLIVRGESNLGLARLRAGDTAGAITALERACGAWASAFGEDHAGIATPLQSLAQAYRSASRFDDSLVTLDRAKAWYQRYAPDNAPGLAAVEANRAITLGAAKRDAEAEGALERAIAALEALKQPPAGLLRTARETLMGVYERVGAPQGKRDELKAAIEKK